MYYNFLTFLLGVITSFSLPPYNFLLLNFLTFPILFLILVNNKKQTNSSWSSFKIGWFFGIGYFISNIYWIVYSLTFDEIFKFIIPFALIIIPSFLGLFYGLITLLSSKFKLEKNFSSILVFSLTFAIIEFFRGFILGGFPWNLIVYSLTNFLESLQILSITGTYSLNLICITFFLLPLMLIFKKSIRFKILLTTFILITLIFNQLYGYWKIKTDEKYYSEFNDLIIKIISPKISIDRFFDSNEDLTIIEEIVKLSNPNDAQKTIFVFPEGALSGFDFEGLKYFKEIFINNYSKNHKIIMGINTVRNNNTYNSMVVLDNQLNLLSEYNKIKLVPFGEFLPLEKFLKKFGLKKITEGYEPFNAGKLRKQINVKNTNFSFVPLICYEIIYSGKIGKNFNDINFIVNISEDGWFGDSIGPHQHFSHSIFRAIEEGKNIIRSANNGISAYIDGNGIIIAKLESTQRGVIEVNKYKKINETIFSKFGNKLFFYFILFYISLIFLNYKKRERL